MSVPTGNDEAVSFIAVGVNFFRQCQPDIIVLYLEANIHLTRL